MTGIYAVVLLVGFVGLTAYVATHAGERSGRVQAITAAAAIASGMAGLSARFAGWSVAAHVSAAIGGAVAGAWYAHRQLRSGEP